MTKVIKAIRAWLRARKGAITPSSIRKAGVRAGDKASVGRTQRR